MPSTTNYQKGDFVLVAFPFSGGSQVKLRPAMVVLDTSDEDVLLARVTTQLHSTPCDVALNEWQASGLPAVPVVRLHKLATIHTRSIVRTLGKLDPTQREAVSAKLVKLLGLTSLPPDRWRGSARS